MKIKTVPIDKKCRVCKQRKLLNEFDIDERLQEERYDSVCKGIGAIRLITANIEEEY
jgi:hypothetical protein